MPIVSTASFGEVGVGAVDSDSHTVRDVSFRGNRRSAWTGKGRVAPLTGRRPPRRRGPRRGSVNPVLAHRVDGRDPCLVR